MDRRRGRKRTHETALEVASKPLGASDMAAILAKLDAVLAEQHELRRLVHRMTVPVDVLSTGEAAKRLGCAGSTMERLAARSIFTDARAPERRVTGCPRIYYADEIDAYRAEGERGVNRIRDELGRN